MRFTLLCLAVLALALCSVSAKKYKEKDMMRKSIVFDKNTPDVFYCATQKPTGFDKLIVRARPLYKLCEYEGQPLPEDYKSDCYKDMDETDFACKEKYRIMVKYNQSPVSVAFNFLNRITGPGSNPIVHN